MADVSDEFFDILNQDAGVCIEVSAHLACCALVNSTIYLADVAGATTKSGGGGETVGAEDLLALVAVTSPNLALLDWKLPGRPEARRAALNVSADAFVSKIDSPDRLLKSLPIANG